jgi:dienelactone hydrolase
MWPILAPFIDEVGAAAIGRLFLWRRGPLRARRVCDHLVVPEFRGDLQQFYGDFRPPSEWTWTSDPKHSSPALEVRDGFFVSPLRTGFPENDRVQVRRWKPADARLSVIGLGGLVQLGYYWFDGLAKSLAARGIEFWMMDEPFNHRRTPPGFLPGELIAGAGPEQLIAAVRQAIIDTRLLIADLRSQGQRVGIVGQSYGGWLALLLSLLEPDLEFAVPLIPMCDLATWYQAGLPLSRGARNRFPRYPKLQLEELLRPINPSAWQPILQPDRIDIHAATRDRLVLYRSIVRLATAWKSGLTVHRAGHYSVFFGSALRERVVNFVLQMEARTPRREPARPAFGSLALPQADRSRDERSPMQSHAPATENTPTM